MLWIKSLHLIAVISWFAGLFYLPRLFVNMAMVTDQATFQHLALMARKLYRFMRPLAILSLVFGLWLWLGYGVQGGWMHAKLLLVLGLYAFHGYCGKLLKDFENQRNTHSHTWYRWFNEIPAVLLVGIIVLVVVKPF
jgi:putative membrane protein